MNKGNKTQINKTNEKNGSIKSHNTLDTIFATNKELDFKIVSLIGFFISLFILYFSYKYFGSFFEMNDDPRYVMAMKGFASPLPYDNFVSVYKFTVDLYIILYKKFPNVGWYGLSMFLMLWGGLFNIYLVFYLAAYKKIKYIFIFTLFISFSFLIFFQNAYFINFTRPSIITTGSFIVLLALLYLNNDVFRKYKWILIFPTVTYILSHLTRLDGGYLGFVFGLGLSILIVFKTENIFPFLLKFILPVVAFILIIKMIDASSQKNNVRNEAFLEKTEIIRKLIDYRNVGAYVPTNAKDTMSYNAMMSARYCSDDNVISVDFLNKLTDKSPELTGANDKKFQDEFGIFEQSLSNENSIAKTINYSLFAILAIWFLSSIKLNGFTFIKYILFQLFFIAIIIGMSYYMKLPARIFNPLLVLLTFGNITYGFLFVKFQNKQFNFILLTPILLILTGVSNYSKANIKLITDYKNYGKVNHMMVNDMNAKFNKSIFIPTNLRSWEMHNATDPIKEINLKNNNNYVYLTIELSLAPETKDQLVDKFGTSNHAELFKNISEMDNVIFISDDNFNNFLRAYYHYIYNQDYYFERVTNEAASISQFTGLDYYRLKKIK